MGRYFDCMTGIFLNEINTLPSYNYYDTEQLDLLCLLKRQGLRFKKKKKSEPQKKGLEETLEKMLKQKMQNFIDQTEQQRGSNKIWKQSLKDNLLKLASQNKVEVTISELQHKETLKSWNQA